MLTESSIPDTKVRVLHIGKYYPPFHGGIENFLCDLAECQLEQGDVEPSVLVHQHEVGRAEETESASGVFVRRVQIVGRAVFTPLAPLFLRSLNRTIEERNPDILHLHLPNPSTFWCLFSKSARKRSWVIHWHSDVLGGVPNWAVRLAYPVYRIFEQALLNRSSTIIATSPPYLETSAPLAAFIDKCQIVPLGIKSLPSNQGAESANRSAAKLKGNSVELCTEENDAADMLPIPERDGTPNLEVPWDMENTTDSYSHPAAKNSAPLKVLCIGRLTYYKGHEYLIRAVAETPDAQLDIVGDGEERKSLSTLIEALSVSERVRILGSLPQADLEDVLSNCDLVCLPSVERTEAFGLVLLEAARAGKPSLVTCVKGSGMSWVVQNGITGWTVEPGSAEDLQQVLADISKNRSELSQRGQLARERFSREFQIAAVASRVQALYSQVGAK